MIIQTSYTLPNTGQAQYPIALLEPNAPVDPSVWYSFGTDNASPLSDLSGKGNHLTDVGTAAVYADNTVSKLPNTSGLDYLSSPKRAPSTVGFTLLAVCKKNTVSSNPIGFGVHGAAFFVMMDLYNGNRPRFFWREGSTTSIGPAAGTTNTTAIAMLLSFAWTGGAAATVTAYSPQTTSTVFSGTASALNLTYATGGLQVNAPYSSGYITQPSLFHEVVMWDRPFNEAELIDAYGRAKLRGEARDTPLVFIDA